LSAAPQMAAICIDPFGFVQGRLFGPQKARALRMTELFLGMSDAFFIYAVALLSFVFSLLFSWSLFCSDSSRSNRCFPTL
jgi:hypothetical protein